MEGRGEVGVRREHLVGYPTVPYPTLRSSSGLFNCSRNEMWGGGVGVNIGWVPYPILPWGVGVNIGCGTLP